MYECSQCHCIDNTAPGNFWDQMRRERPFLCTSCDPDIQQWHDMFERLHIDEYRKRYPDGHIQWPQKEAE